MALGEGVFARDSSYRNRRERNRRVIAASDEQFSGARDLGMLNEQIQIAVVAHARVAVSAKCENRPFDGNDFDTSRGEAIEQTQQFRRHGHRGEKKGTLALLQLGESFRRYGVARVNGIFAQGGETRGEQIRDAVLSGSGEDGIPILTARQIENLLSPRDGRRASGEQRPFRRLAMTWCAHVLGQEVLRRCVEEAGCAAAKILPRKLRGKLGGALEGLLPG